MFDARGEVVMRNQNWETKVSLEGVSFETLGLSKELFIYCDARNKNSE